MSTPKTIARAVTLASACAPSHLASARTSETMTAASGRYIRCSTIIWVVPGARLVGARIRKNHAAINPILGARIQSQTDSASKAMIAATCAARANPGCGQYVPYSKTRGYGTTERRRYVRMASGWVSAYA